MHVLCLRWLPEPEIRTIPCIDCTKWDNHEQVSTFVLIPMPIFHHANQAIKGTPMIKGGTCTIPTFISGRMIVFANVAVGVPLTHH